MWPTYCVMPRYLQLQDLAVRSQSNAAYDIGIRHCYCTAVHLHCQSRRGTLLEMHGDPVLPVANDSDCQMMLVGPWLRASCCRLSAFKCKQRLPLPLLQAPVQDAASSRGRLPTMGPQPSKQSTVPPPVRCQQLAQRLHRKVQPKLR